MEAVFVKQTILTLVYMAITLVMFYKVVLPTLNVTLPYLKTKMSTGWYWLFAITLIVLEVMTYSAITDSYHHLMWWLKS